MSTEASELHRIISASVRDMLDAYRLQAQAGPVTDKALDEILFRAAHVVLQSRYAHLSPAHLRAGVDALDGLTASVADLHLDPRREKGDHGASLNACQHVSTQIRT